MSRKGVSPHTQETGHSGVSGVRGVQIHLMGVEPSGRDGQVAAQPVDILHERHVHLQGPLPRGLVCVADIDAGTSGGRRRGGPGASGWGGVPDSSRADRMAPQEVFPGMHPGAENTFYTRYQRG